MGQNFFLFNLKFLLGVVDIGFAGRRNAAVYFRERTSRSTHLEKELQNG
jgi:hypothetical protein